MKHRLTAMVGLVALVPVGLGLVRGSLTLSEAGFRAGVLIVVLGLVDSVAVPIMRALVGPPVAEDDGEAESAPGPDALDLGSSPLSEPAVAESGGD